MAYKATRHGSNKYVGVLELPCWAEFVPRSNDESLPGGGTDAPVRGERGSSAGQKSPALKDYWPNGG